VKFAPAVFVLFAACVSADDLSGRIVGVSDGDTMTLLSNGEQIKIRLAEIDAPEKSQPFGVRSKQSLSDLCFNRSAVVKNNGRDRYGRIIGRAVCDGKDVSAEQVHRGLAWVYDRYVTDRSLYAIQDDARASNKGLWVDSSPVPPWDWRRSRR
jgi:endonuclease YncB( thermonuclease family)